MDNLEVVRGIVLKHAPVGDYDWTVTLFTAERGKITAFAKNARKPGLKLSGCVEPFCFGTFKLYVGKNSYTLVEADIDNYFEGFRQDLEGALYGTFSPLSLTCRVDDSSYIIVRLKFYPSFAH